MASSSTPIRDFKEEPDDFVPESPRRLPLALGGPGEKYEISSFKHTLNIINQK